MQRQLKFRAWDKLAKQFTYPDKGYTEFMGDAIDFLIDHPEFNKEKFLKTNPQLKEVVEKAIKEREDRKKYAKTT